MRALGDPTRLAIVERLGQGPRPVGELAATFPVTRSAVSQHLKVLKDAGLVQDQRVGNRNVYRLDRVGLEVVQRYLDQVWGEALEAFRATVEAQEDAP